MQNIEEIVSPAEGRLYLLLSLSPPSFYRLSSMHCSLSQFHFPDLAFSESCHSMSRRSTQRLHKRSVSIKFYVVNYRCVVFRRAFGRKRRAFLFYSLPRPCVTHLAPIFLYFISRAIISPRAHSLISLFAHPSIFLYAV